MARDDRDAGPPDPCLLRSGLPVDLGRGNEKDPGTSPADRKASLGWVETQAEAGLAGEVAPTATSPQVIPSSHHLRSFSRPALAAPIILGIAALAYGTLQASRLAWTTDDAYISFRYAEHLINGHGLVFNLGERVEGYSNFLWTLWCALGLRLGLAPEAWANFWSLACYAGTLALLCLNTISRPRHSGPALPVAAMVAAVHHDWHIFATSGLETSLFCLLAVAGYCLLVAPELDVRRLAAAGAFLGLAALTRPDGVLWGAFGAVYVLWVGRARLKAAIAYGAPFCALWLPYLAWKLWYYGDLFPNTYYAKSAYWAWYSQGWIYLELYFVKYWPLLLGLPLAAWGAISSLRARSPEVSRARRTWGRATALAAAFALVYSWFVARVGGDFMYARLLIPATPFFAILLELGLERLAPRWPVVRAALATVALVAIALASYPFRGQGWVHGIVNEYEFYSDRDRAQARRTGEALRQLFEGLPIRMAFTGGQAILAYYSKAPLAIETATGLTDRFIAHQKLTGRGRVGHEKKTPFLYLISQRRAHFWMYTGSLLSDSLATYIPLVPLELAGMKVMVLSWDPPVMEALGRRGAQVEDFPAILERYLEGMASASDEEVQRVYEKSRRFYFDHVNDPAREAPFLARLRSVRR